MFQVDHLFAWKVKGLSEHFEQDKLDQMTKAHAFDTMCDCFTRYIKLTCMLGIPACPTKVFCALLARPPHNRPGYNARDFVPSRVEVSAVLKQIKHSNMDMKCYKGVVTHLW